MKVNESFIKKINDGDRNAERELFDYTKSKIKEFLDCTYPKSSEDDTSDIVIKIFEKINLFNDKKSKYSTWIVNVAKNHMIDKSRLYANNVFFYSTSNNANVDGINVTCAESGSMITYNLTSGIDVVGDLEISDDIKTLTNSISCSDMSLLNMKYKSGYTYDEIGREIDMDKTKVLNRVNYIKKKIKKGE
jgi:RNA polymerase sigma-70 factor (ECF subfamily)